MLRIIYTLCFVLLGVVNFIVGSQTGRVQFVGINCAGLVVAVIILSAYKLKDFLKPIYFVWTGIVVIAGAYAIFWGRSNYPHFGRWITAVLNVAVYGYIVIRVIVNLAVEKSVRPIRWVTLSLWVAMIVLMVVSPNESVWPLWFGVMFLSMYLTDFGKERLKALLDGLADGLVINFLLFQGLAFVFRPYDISRYNGFFANTNMNALFYIVSFAACATKWSASVRRGKKALEKYVWALLSCSVYGFVFLTASKAALFAMVPLSLVFLVSVIIGEDRKVALFIKYCIVIGVLAVFSIPVTYLAVRYLPTVHLHPIYFEGEWNPYKVQPGDGRDSEAYVSFKEYLGQNFGRILWFIDFEDENALTEIEEDAPEKEEREIINDCYLLTDEEAATIDPIRLRVLIHSYYLEHLNVFGHATVEDGVPYTKYETIPHAHNWIIQMSFSYGIIVGLLFLYMVVQYVILVIKAAKAGDYRFVCLVGGIITAFLVFGFFEMAWAMGHIQFLLFFILYYFAVSVEEPPLAEKSF